MTSSPRIWLIIPVHNRREITRCCLHHLAVLKVAEGIRILVVDDGSTDGTRQMIVEEFPWVEMIHGDGRLWWAGAIHQGMKHAITSGADCVCWLNDDCLPNPGSLELLTKTAMARSAICGGLCRDSKKSSMTYSGGFMTKGWPSPLKEPLPVHNQEIPVDWLHGNLVAIPASVWERIGLPECRWMRHNLADIFYTHRARKAGIEVLLTQQATAVAEVNQGLSYRSWADPAISTWHLLSGLWNPRVWWYAPGLGYFLVALQGWRGWLRGTKFGVKLLILCVLKSILPSQRIAQLRMYKH